VARRGKTRPAAFSPVPLNYELPDGSVTAPHHPHADDLAFTCQAIMEQPALDVRRWYAASHNSVDDVRQINDAIRSRAGVGALHGLFLDE